MDRESYSKWKEPEVEGLELWNSIPLYLKAVKEMERKRRNKGDKEMNPKQREKLKDTLTKIVRKYRRISKGLSSEEIAEIILLEIERK